MALDRELQEYYEQRFGTMSSKGWNDFIEDTQAIKDTITIDNLKSAEELWFAKGQLDILNWVLNIKKASEQAYDELTDA
jgi:hypothetical protein